MTYNHLMKYFKLNFNTWYNILFRICHTFYTFLQKELFRLKYHCNLQHLVYMTSFLFNHKFKLLITFLHMSGVTFRISRCTAIFRFSREVSFGSYTLSFRYPHRKKIQWALISGMWWPNPVRPERNQSMTKCFL